MILLISTASLPKLSTTSQTSKCWNEDLKDISALNEQSANVCCSIIYKTQDVETFWMSINGWIDKYVAHTYNRILPSLKKGNLVICANVNVPWRHYVKWNMPETEGHILYDFAYTRNLK